MLHLLELELFFFYLTYYWGSMWISPRDEDRCITKDVNQE